MTLKVGLLTLRQILINLTKTQLRHDIDTEGAHQVGDGSPTIGINRRRGSGPPRRA